MRPCQSRHALYLWAAEKGTRKRPASRTLESKPRLAIEVRDLDRVDVRDARVERFELWDDDAGMRAIVPNVAC